MLVNAVLSPPVSYVRNLFTLGPDPRMQQRQPHLSLQVWETLIEDFQFGIPSRHAQWLLLPLLDLTLASLPCKDFPLSFKPRLLFLEESSDILFRHSPSSSLPLLIDSLRSLLLLYTHSELLLKKQAMVSTTVIAIASLDIHYPHLIDPSSSSSFPCELPEPRT